MSDQPEASPQITVEPPLTKEETAKLMKFLADEYGSRVTIVVLASKIDPSGHGSGIAFLSNASPEIGMRIVHAIAEVKR